MEERLEKIQLIILGNPQGVIYKQVCHQQYERRGP
jgi:hypothetical protein